MEGVTGKKLPQNVEQMLAVDLEDAPTIETKQEPKVQTAYLPHDSAYVYSQLKDRHTLKVFPTLDTNEKDNKAAILLVVFVAISVFSAWGVAYEVQYSFTPHVQGICDAPAVIENGGCFTVQTATGANGNTVTTLVPAGHLANHP